MKSWLVLVLLIGGTAGWLFVMGEVMPSERSVPARFIIKLPPPIISIPSLVKPKETKSKSTSPPAAPLKANPAGQTAIPIPPPSPPLSLEPSLAPPPNTDLVKESQKDSSSVIRNNGWEPWQIYARPFDVSDERPRIAIVINWLGLSDAATEATIQELPGSITLAFAPYAENLTNWVRSARAAGHEVLLNLPMEPLNYPENDPGPQALLTSLSPAYNLEHLEWTLSRVTGYVGVTNYMGSRFTTSSTSLKPMLKALKDRGLLFLDSRSSSQSPVLKIASELELPWVANDRFLDNHASRVAIDSELKAIETVARSQGYAVGISFPYPVTLERLAVWIPTLQKKGFVLVPISAIARAAEKSE